MHTLRTVAVASVKSRPARGSISAMQNVCAYQGLLHIPLGRLQLPRRRMVAAGPQRLVRLCRSRTHRHNRLQVQTRAIAGFSGTPALLIGLGVFLAGTSLAVFLIAAIPTLLSLRRAARAAEIMIYTVERELPETAAALRLSSLELSDAIEEVSLLSNDVSSGVRASAAAVVAAEQGVRQGAQYLDLAVKNAVIPTVKRKVPAARDAVETQLLQNAKLKHTAPDLRQLACSSRQLTQRLRFGLGVLQVLKRAATAQQRLRMRLLLGSS